MFDLPWYAIIKYQHTLTGSVVVDTTAEVLMMGWIRFLMILSPNWKRVHFIPDYPSNRYLDQPIIQHIQIGHGRDVLQCEVLHSSSTVPSFYHRSLDCISHTHIHLSDIGHSGGREDQCLTIHSHQSYLNSVPTQNDPILIVFRVSKWSIWGQITIST